MKLALNKRTKELNISKSDEFNQAEFSPALYDL